jgi:hypothetical protein
MHEYTRVIGTDCHESLVRVRLERLTASSIDKSCVVSQGNRMSAYFLNSMFDLQTKEQETILAMKI